MKSIRIVLGHLAAVVALIVVAIPAARACDMLKACQDVRYCAYDNKTPANKWREDLQRVMGLGAWSNMLDDTDACQNAIGASNGDDWTRNKQGCDAQTLGMLARNANCVSAAPPPSPPPQKVYYCRSNGQTIPFGRLLPGFGVCEGPEVVGAACHCGNAPGQVQ